jgi:hypothetical protein
MHVETCVSFGLAGVSLPLAAQVLVDPCLSRYLPLAHPDAWQAGSVSSSHTAYVTQ